jgi:hypothetical protein
MPAQGQTSQQYFNQLSILHGALLMAQVMFGFVAYYLVANGNFGQSADLTGIFQVVASVLAVGGIAASMYVSKKLLKGFVQKKTLAEKLSAYRGPLLIRWALLEMPTMFSLVGYLLTGSYFFLLLAALMVALFVFNRPTPSAACADLELSASDKMLLENPNSVVL